MAKTQVALQALSAQQEKGYIIKEYGALAAKRARLLPGFPQAFFDGVDCCTITSGFRPYGPGRKAVRPVVFPIWGGSGFPRKQEKFRKTSALDQGRPYRTEIIEPYCQRSLHPVIGNNASREPTYFRVRIKRGFRHQIRCHLAWIGYPILNDTLYGGLPGDNIPFWNASLDRVGLEGMGFPVLGLIAQGIRFYDPVSAEIRHYTIQIL
jgi:23S rRNA pseudouridine1911/1915/1917 synthase